MDKRRPTETVYTYREPRRDDSRLTPNERALRIEFLQKQVLLLETGYPAQAVERMLDSHPGANIGVIKHDA